MLIIGYEYKSALGKTIRRAVVCENETEYKKIKERIEDAGLEPIEFCQIIKASVII